LLPDIKGKVTAERELENHGGDAFKKAVNIPANNKIAIYSFFRFIISYVLKFSTLFYTPLQRRYLC